MISKADSEVRTRSISVRLYGSYRELASDDSISIRLSEDGDVAELARQLHGRFPGKLPGRPTIVVNLRVARDDQRVLPTDEVAVVPAVAGG